jgi:hypothetical protein
MTKANILRNTVKTVAALAAIAMMTAPAPTRGLAPLPRQLIIKQIN